MKCIPQEFLAGFFFVTTGINLMVNNSPNHYPGLNNSGLTLTLNPLSVLAI